MAIKLFETNNRDESHQKAEELRSQYPEAECRENIGTNTYQVWSCSSPPPEAPSPVPVIVISDAELSDTLIDRLAERLLERMAKKDG